MDGPLGVFSARILEAHGILPGIQGLWQELTKTADPPPPTGLEFFGPFASLALTDMVVSFETFLRSLDATVRPVALPYFPRWPRPRRSNKPYGFFFYDLRKVRKHFRQVLGIDVFYRTRIAVLLDWVQLRHLFAHANGIPGRADVGKFKHYRIFPGRRLLVRAEVLNEAATTFLAVAPRINNRIGAAVVKAALVRWPSLRWSRAQRTFLPLMRTLTYFGTTARSQAHAELIYRTAVALYAPRREGETGLAPVPRPVQATWST